MSLFRRYVLIGAIVTIAPLCLWANEEEGEIPGQMDPSVVEAIIHGDQLRGATLYIAIKGMFRDHAAAMECQQQVAQLEGHYIEGVDLSTHYDGVRKGYWMVFSAFDTKAAAKEWLANTPNVSDRKGTVKKVIKHSGEPVPHNPSVAGPDAVLSDM